MEISKPNLFQHILNLLSLEIFHQIRNEIGVFSLIVIVGSLSIQESSEVSADRKIDKNLLIEGCIIIALDCSYIFKLWEIS
jgi:hypothetical protein